jgi:hypothetical protein
VQVADLEGGHGSCSPWAGQSPALTVRWTSTSTSSPSMVTG